MYFESWDFSTFKCFVFLGKAHIMSSNFQLCVLDDPFSKKLFGTIGFQLGDGIRCLESEAQNSELSLEVAKIQFSLSGL